MRNIKFQKIRVACFKKLSEQKRERWRKLVNSFNDKTSTKQIWSLIKSFKSNITGNNGTTQDFRNALLEIISKICPSFSYCDHSKTLEAMKSEDNQNLCICTWLDDPLTSEELKNAFSS